MIRLRKIALKILVCVAAMSFLVSCGGGGEQLSAVVLPLDSVRNGDIVFRRGCSFSSEMIMSHERENKYTHIGVVCRNDSGCFVIHAVNEEYDFPGDFDRVKIDPIEAFFAPDRARAGAICHSWLGDSVQEVIMSRAMELVHDSVRFDSGFNHDDSAELYCSELVYMLYRDVGIDITEGRRTPVGVMFLPDEIIFPDDILLNKNLQEFFVF